MSSKKNEFLKQKRIPEQTTKKDCNSDDKEEVKLQEEKDSNNVDLHLKEDSNDTVGNHEKNSNPNNTNNNIIIDKIPVKGKKQKNKLMNKNFFKFDKFDEDASFYDIIHQEADPNEIEMEDLNEFLYSQNRDIPFIKIRNCISYNCEETDKKKIIISLNNNNGVGKSHILEMIPHREELKDVLFLPTVEMVSKPAPEALIIAMLQSIRVFFGFDSIAKLKAEGIVYNNIIIEDICELLGIIFNKKNIKKREAKVENALYKLLDNYFSLYKDQERKIDLELILNKVKDKKAVYFCFDEIGNVKHTTKFKFEEEDKEKEDNKGDKDDKDDKNNKDDKDGKNKKVKNYRSIFKPISQSHNQLFAMDEIRLLLNYLLKSKLGVIVAGKNGIESFMGIDGNSLNSIKHINLPPLLRKYIKPILKFELFRKSNSNLRTYLKNEYPKESSKEKKDELELKMNQLLDKLFEYTSGHPRLLKCTLGKLMKRTKLETIDDNLMIKIKPTNINSVYSRYNNKLIYLYFLYQIDNPIFKSLMIQIDETEEMNETEGTEEEEMEETEEEEMEETEEEMEETEEEEIKKFEEIEEREERKKMKLNGKELLYMFYLLNKGKCKSFKKDNIKDIFKVDLFSIDDLFNSIGLSYVEKADKTIKILIPKYISNLLDKFKIKSFRYDFACKLMFCKYYLNEEKYGEYMSIFSYAEEKIFKDENISKILWIEGSCKSNDFFNTIFRQIKNENLKQNRIVMFEKENNFAIDGLMLKFEDSKLDIYLIQVKTGNTKQNLINEHLKKLEKSLIEPEQSKSKEDKNSDNNLLSKEDEKSNIKLVKSIHPTLLKVWNLESIEIKITFILISPKSDVKRNPIKDAEENPIKDTEENPIKDAKENQLIKKENVLYEKKSISTKVLSMTDEASERHYKRKIEKEKQDPQKKKEKINLE